MLFKFLRDIMKQPKTLNRSTFLLKKSDGSLIGETKPFGLRSITNEANKKSSETFTKTVAQCNKTILTQTTKYMFVGPHSLKVTSVNS